MRIMRHGKKFLLLKGYSIISEHNTFEDAREELFELEGHKLSEIPELERGGVNILGEYDKYFTHREDV